MKVLLVDDHPLFIEGLTNLLKSHGVHVVGTAANGLQALYQARTLRPDIVLMDLQMPEHDGFEGISLIKSELPDIQVVVLTVYENCDNLLEAFRRGASGYLLKSLSTDELLDLLVSLEHGEAVISRAMATVIMKEFSDKTSPSVEHRANVDEQDHTISALSSRQIDVLQRVAQGQTYKDISVALGIGSRTVQYHMGEIIRKLHLRNRAQVIAYARSGY